MKKIYHSDDLRTVIKGIKKITPIRPCINIQIQKRIKKWIFSSWKTVNEIDVEIDEYWRIWDEGPDHLTLPKRIGCNTEVYYPDKFDLEKRCEALLNEYLGRQSAITRSSNKLKNELKKISA